MTKRVSTQSAGTVVGALLLLSYLTSRFAGAGPSSMEDIHRKVIADTERQYQIARAQGDPMQKCVQAGIVSAAYLQAHDSAGYKTAKDEEDLVCYEAGVPGHPVPQFLTSQESSATQKPAVAPRPESEDQFQSWARSEIRADNFKKVSADEMWIAIDQSHTPESPTATAQLALSTYLAATRKQHAKIVLFARNEEIAEAAQ